MADDNSWSSSNSKFFPFQLLFLASSFKTCNVYLCERMESTIAAKTFWLLQIWAGNPRLLKDSAILHTESCFVRTGSHQIAGRSWADHGDPEADIGIRSSRCS